MAWKNIKGDNKGRKHYRCKCGNAAVIVVKELELVQKHRGPRAERLAIYCPACNTEPLRKLKTDLPRVGYPRRRRLKKKR